MNSKQQEIIYSSIWLIGTIAFISLGLELYLFQIADYDVYQVLNIGFQDLVVLATLLGIQYILLKKVVFHFERLWQNILLFKHGKYYAIITTSLIAGLFYLLPFRFSFNSFFLLLSSLAAFSFLITRFVTNPFHKILFILLFLGGINSSLIFWMHEETNGGRHIRYAQQLAEAEDTIAVKILSELGELGEKIPEIADEYDFWEKKWMENNYLFSNYKFRLDATIADSTALPYQPILEIDEDKIPAYKIIFPNQYALIFKLNTEFRRSIYSPNEPYKRLKDLSDFQFAVVNESKITLSNSHVFDANILDVDLPAIGTGKKIELKGFDILAYRDSKETFVIIGEPLSEMQVWMSNFAFLFSLLMIVATFLEILNLFLLKKKVFNHWQELPIQFRIQIIIIALTCSLFFIIAITTFVFLRQNNFDISNERQIYMAEMLRDQILEKSEQYDWDLEDFSVQTLSELSDSKQCDIDLYNVNRGLIVSSYASALNSLSPNAVSSNIIDQIRKNPSLIIVDWVDAEKKKEDYVRTYFGIFKNDEFKGLVSTSSLESEIGTASYIPIVMVKLLNVYVFLLVISWLGSVFLIKLLTRPLQLLANRLSNFKLGEENQRLKWKGNDAIGQLIFEYNLMLDKVEVTRQQLMRNEREDAWQVMSLQIAHEINNKLTPLRLNIQFLTRIIDSLEIEDADRIQRITNGLVEKVDMLSKVASQFKLFAKLETPNIKPIDLDVFIEAFLEKYEKDEAHQYVFENQLAIDVKPIIKIDTQHLQEVLNNLFLNAENSIESQENGEVRIRLNVENNDMIIEIKDNGEGLEDWMNQNIFDPKFSVTSSETGLGLSITKRIIEFYNGKIEFQSNIETGNSFIITLPF